MPKVTRRQFLYGIASASAGIGLFQYGSADKLTLERRELRLPKWDAEGFRVAVLADLHADSPRRTRRAMAAVKMAMAELPDLIVISGDHASSTEPDVLNQVKCTFDLFHEAKCPVVAVMGNHDYWGAQPRKLIDVIRRSPVKLLRNEDFEVGGVTISGIDDALMKHHRVDFMREDRSSRSTIALLHEPDFVSIVPECASLQISGHSHGGQICLPFGICIHTPRGAWNYVEGYYPEARVPLYVTRGVGTTGPDVRLFCKPEVSVLTLRSA